MHYEVIQGLVPQDTLLIHGNLAGNLWWEPAIEAFRRQAQASKTAGTELMGSLIVAEWKGCGKSTGATSDAELEMTALADDYLDLLGTLGIGKANVIGHSTGGLIALVALAKGSDRLSRAVLLDPVAARGRELGPEMLAAFQKMREDRAFCEQILQSTIHGVDRADPLFQRIVDNARACHPTVWEGIPRVLARTDFEPELGNVRQPVLILHGDQDPILPIAESERLAGMLPEGRFTKLAGHGHSCNIEDPERFVELSWRFLFG